MSTDFQVAEGFTRLRTEPFFCEFAEGKPLLNYDEVADFAELGLIIKNTKHEQYS